MTKKIVFSFLFWKKKALRFSLLTVVCVDKLKGNMVNPNYTFRKF